MNADEYITRYVEKVLRQAEDEIVRLRSYGSPTEKREAAMKLAQVGFVPPGNVPMPDGPSGSVFRFGISN